MTNPRTRRAGGAVKAEDLAWFADTFADLAEATVVACAWGRGETTDFRVGRYLGPDPCDGEEGWSMDEVAAPLYRPRHGRVIAGVCAGIARRFGWSPWLVRLLFVLSCALPGPQVLVYVALWLLMPNEQATW